MNPNYTPFLFLAYARMQALNQFYLTPAFFRRRRRMPS
jgi:hypothetical protein